MITKMLSCFINGGYALVHASNQNVMIREANDQSTFEDKEQLLNCFFLSF